MIYICFVKINNRIFDEFKKNIRTTTIGIISCEGFTLYTYLLSIRGNSGEISTTINMIKSNFKNIRGFKKNESVKRRLKMLHSVGLIDIIDVDKNIKPNDLIQMSIIDPETYQAIPIQLIKDKLEKIGCIGFSLLCLMVKLHNVKNGYANPSIEYLSYNLGLSKNAIIKYLKILEEEDLIVSERQDMFLIKDVYGIPAINKLNNIYRVSYLVDKNNTYYMPKEKRER